jgi:hypothetical protein
MPERERRRASHAPRLGLSKKTLAAAAMRCIFPPPPVTGLLLLLLDRDDVLLGRGIPFLLFV